MKTCCALLFFLLFSVAVPLNGQIPNTISKDSLIKLGEHYFLLSEEVIERSLDSCIIYTMLARDCFAKAEQWDKYVDMYTAIAGAYYYQGNYEQALDVNQAALVAAKQYLGEKHSSYANALVTRAVLQQRKGEVEESIKTLQLSLELAEQAGVVSERQKTSTLHNLSLAYTSKGDYLNAILCLEQVLKYRLKESELDYLDIARVHMDLGKNNNALKKYREALGYYFIAISILSERPSGKFINDRRIESSLNVASIYQALGIKDSTVYFVKQALKVQNAGNDRLKEKSFELLGQVELEQGNYLKASEYYNQALSITKGKYEKYNRHPNIASSIFNLANVQQQQRKYPEALHLYQQALIQLSRAFNYITIGNNPANEELMDKLEGIKILRAKASTLSRHYQQVGGLKLLYTAHATYQQLAELIALVRRSYREEESKYYLAEAAAEIYEEAIETALLLHQQQPDPDYLQAAFDFAERNKATLLQENIQARLASGLADTPDSLLAQERKYKTAISFYEREIAAQASQKGGGDAAKVKLWKEQLFEAKQAYEKIEQQLLKGHTRYRELKRQEQLVDLPGLQQQLGQQQRALIEYFYGKRQVYAFLLTPSEVKAYQLGAPEAITAAVQQLRGISSRPPDSRTFAEDYAQFQTLATSLYQQLLAPLQSAIPEGITRLGIIPDDVLNYLPFDLLLTEKPKAGELSFSPQKNTYLFDRYTLSYAYSASLSVAMAKETKASASFLGFAPNFGDIASAERSCSANELSALLCNEQEIQSISALFPGQTFVEGQATKSQFEALSGHYQILHLATHACLDAEGGKLNKIFFADDYLSNFELANLDLKADLVVLSACNTGTGQLIRGEGVLSLARGFTIAGCPGTLMSLWAVDDCSTSRLMLRLYEQLKKGKAKDEALRQARLQFLAESDEEHRHPYYWAAFVQFGNIEALSGVGEAERNWYIWGLAGVLVLIALYRIIKN